jgi:hypothetical protein
MRLLDRQRRLLEYLTSGGAIFGDPKATLDRDLKGMARERLHLEARFSHEKRMEKIAAVFPRTITLLANRYPGIVRSFAEACPPRDFSRIANALQFHGFLQARWTKRKPRPPHVRDVATCELACAQVRFAADNPCADMLAASNPGIRRRRDAVLLRCTHDIRALFESHADAAAPVARQICIVVMPDRYTAEPHILGIAPEVLELVSALDTWTDPTIFGPTPEAAALIAELVELGLLEMRH